MHPNPRRHNKKKEEKSIKRNVSLKDLRSRTPGRLWTKWHISFQHLSGQKFQGLDTSLVSGVVSLWPPECCVSFFALLAPRDRGVGTAEASAAGGTAQMREASAEQVCAGRVSAGLSTWPV